LGDSPILPGPTWTEEEIITANHGDIHPEAVSGLSAFNRGDFFEAHEHLENAWRAEPGPARDVYRGILQIGLAYYHILRGNFRGAVKMFQRSKPWLSPYPTIFRGIDVARLRQDACMAEDELLQLGADRLHSYRKSLIRPIHFTVTR
jgi:hypothetical protein